MNILKKYRILFVLLFALLVGTLLPSLLFAQTPIDLTALNLIDGVKVEYDLNTDDYEVFIFQAYSQVFQGKIAAGYNNDPYASLTQDPEYIGKTYTASDVAYVFVPNGTTYVHMEPKADFLARVTDYFALYVNPGFTCTGLGEFDTCNEALPPAGESEPEDVLTPNITFQYTPATTTCEGTSTSSVCTHEYTISTSSTITQTIDIGVTYVLAVIAGIMSLLTVLLITKF